MDEFLQAAQKLHQYIRHQHEDNGAIVGPDPIGKIHWRVTRFVRSYFPWLPGDDRYVYMQAQAYWIKANASLFDLTQDAHHLELIEGCAGRMVQAQLPAGPWQHPPIRGRRGFISTVESVWACLGLVAAYRQLRKPAYLDAARRGYSGLTDAIGFRRLRDSLAINYHAHTQEMVPNVTTMVLWLSAELRQLTGDTQYLQHARDMLRFLEYSLMENGELQYIYEKRPHFQCYQYNAFEFMDLAHYYQLTCDDQVRPLLGKMAAYLAGGLTGRASCRYDCFKEVPEVNYWTAALATALRYAHELKLGDYLPLSERAYAYLLTRQKPDGGFGFSRRNYGVLRDGRSYPRYLAMILNFISHRASVAATG
jgi:hypothetical protein